MRNYPEDRYLERLARDHPACEVTHRRRCPGHGCRDHPRVRITTITSHPPAKPWDHRVSGNYVFFGFGNKLALDHRACANYLYRQGRVHNGQDHPACKRELRAYHGKCAIVYQGSPSRVRIAWLVRHYCQQLQDHPACAELPDSSMQRCIK